MALCLPLGGCSFFGGQKEKDAAPKVIHHSPLKNRMFLLAFSYGKPSSTAYLLLENGTVLSFGDKAGSLSTAQARQLLTAAAEPVYVGATLVEGVKEKGVAKILTVTFHAPDAADCVSYILRTDGKMEVIPEFKNNGFSSVEMPFTFEEAKMLMADIGCEIYY